MLDRLFSFLGSSHEQRRRQLSELKNKIPAHETVSWFQFSNLLGAPSVWSCPENSALFEDHSKIISARLLAAAHRGRLPVYGDTPNTSLPELPGKADTGITALVANAASEFAGHAIYIGRDIGLSYRTHDVIDMTIVHTPPDMPAGKEYLHNMHVMLGRTEQTIDAMRGIFINPRILWDLFSTTEKGTLLNQPVTQSWHPQKRFE